MRGHPLTPPPRSPRRRKKENKAPIGPSGHFPQRGKILVIKSSPSGGSTGEAGVGGLFKTVRPSPNPLPQGEGLSVLALAPFRGRGLGEGVTHWPHTHNKQHTRPRTRALLRRRVDHNPRRHRQVETVRPPAHGYLHCNIADRFQFGGEACLFIAHQD